MTPAKRLRAAVIVQLLKEGWRPPPLPTDAAERLLDDIAATTTGRQTLELTDREHTILEGIATGETEAEIADDLGLAPDTVHKAQGKIREKLGARNAAHAVAIAAREGLLDQAA